MIRVENPQRKKQTRNLRHMNSHRLKSVEHRSLACRNRTLSSLPRGSQSRALKNNENMLKTGPESAVTTTSLES
jgi:hypothetical protein